MLQLTDFETHLKYDPGQRGLAKEMAPGTLAIAADKLRAAKSVAIATGFFVPAAGTIESDGPPGAAFLAQALENIGKRVVILCPDSAAPAMRVCAKHLSISFTVYPLQMGTEVSQGILDEIACDVFVGLEYPGQGKDGVCRNMRGIDISQYVPALDSVLNHAKTKGVYTIAIGDGGNELGVGSAGLRAASTLPGVSIASGSDADSVVCAGISNWGAYAIIAALSVMENESLLPTGNDEQLLLQELCGVGVVDGCTHKCEPTVDGMVAEVCIDFLEELHTLTNQFLEQKRVAAASA